MARGILFLVAGPAGVGKTTLLQRLVREDGNLVKAVSVTTRAARVGEVDGVAYHFWTDEQFKAAAQRSEFLEHANVHGRSYGTLARFVEEKLDAGLDVIKDIDVQGVDQIKRLERYKYPNAVSIFVMPPSHDELVARLEKRASEDEKSASVRLRNAEMEMKRAAEFDHQVINDNIDHALETIKKVVAQERAKRMEVPPVVKGG